METKYVIKRSTIIIGLPQYYIGQEYQSAWGNELNAAKYDDIVEAGRIINEELPDGIYQIKQIQIKKS